MFEIEKKFILTPGDKERLLEGAEFVSEKVNHDSYYDTDDYSLTKAGHWLRKRNGNFELKKLISHDFERDVTHYDEIENEPTLRNFLHLPESASLAEDLAAAGYEPFLTYEVSRKSYKSGDFRIDFDLTDYGYEMVEIELLINDESNREQAEGRLMEFAQQKGLEIGFVRGKVLEYLYRNNPEHFQALVKAGVAK